MERETDRRIGAASAVMRTLHGSVVVKRELSRKAKLSIYQSIYVPALTYGHELWVMTERTRSRVQAAEMSFLRRVAGLSLRDRVRSSVIREELGVDPLLLRVERSQMRWLGHLVRMPPGRLPGEVFRARPTGRRPRGRPRTRWRDYVSMWMQLQIPKIEDGNNFGVSVQEKVFELLTNTRTKIEAFQTQISKYYSERGDAVAKASKQPHVGDYRQLVHELDQYQYCELRLVVLEIRNTYAVLFDIINKNYDKIMKPRGDCKALIY
ncbi:Proteasome activator complex subunit 1 [Merluccius polli]|uniref:Proteasome activator complex subunit 1 n=1 Tax=Merluccius polli TaxID=89951 RepID=A0AA47MQ73_MERPO|nr:Proteasome activator complex subunit 1 [Merluccius polli]